MSTTIKLNGITCEGCVKMASKRIGKIEGVTKVEVNLDGTTQIEAARAIGKDEISQALVDTHYSVAEV